MSSILFSSYVYFRGSFGLMFFIYFSCVGKVNFYDSPDNSSNVDESLFSVWRE